MKKLQRIKTCFIMVVLCLACYSGYAQVARFGIRAGANLANIKGDQDDDNEVKFGIHLGPYAKIPVNDYLDFVPELLFSMKGAQSSDNSNYKILLNYLDIPVIINLHHFHKFYFEFGPTVGILLSAKSKAGGTTVDVKNSFKGSDLGILAGIGYEINHTYGIGLRYQLGVTNIYKTDVVENHNTNIMITLSYTFNRKHAE